MTTVAEFQQEAELQELWYQPWWTQISFIDVITVLFIVLLVIALVMHLIEGQNYMIYWRQFGRFCIRLIVVAETIKEIAPYIKKAFRTNFDKEKCLRKIV